MSTDGARQEIPFGLTPRETEVTNLMALGLTNPEVARRLNISVHAVKYHAASIFRKLNVTNRTEAAVTYLRFRKNEADSSRDGALTGTEK